MDEVKPLSVEDISGLLREKFSEVIQSLERYTKRWDDFGKNDKFQRVMNDIEDADSEFSEQSEELWMDEQHIGGEAFPIREYYKKPDDENLKGVICSIIKGYSKKYTSLGIEYLKKNLKKEELEKIKGLNLQERTLKTPKQPWIDALEKEKTYLEPLRKAPNPDWYFENDDTGYKLNLRYITTFRIPNPKGDAERMDTAESIKQLVTAVIDEDIKCAVELLIQHGVSILCTPATLGGRVSHKDEIMNDSLEDLVSSAGDLFYRVAKNGYYYFMSIFNRKRKTYDGEAFSRESEIMLEEWRSILECWGANEINPLLVIDEKSDIKEEVRKYCNNLKLSELM